MGLFDFLFGSPRRKRRSPSRSARTTRRASPRRSAPDPRRREQEQRRRADERGREQRERREARTAAAAARRHVREREREALLIQRQQLELARRTERERAQRSRREGRLEMKARKQAAVEMHRGERRRVRSYDEIFGTNPRHRAASQQSVASRSTTTRRERNPASRSALAAAAGSLASRGRVGNPFWGDIAKGVIAGLATEEVKGLRQRQLGPFGSVKPRKPRKRATSAPRKAQRAQKNPAVLVPNHPDERLQRASERFHGERGHVMRLGPDQRRPLPEYVVDVGQEIATVYKPARSSQRGGVVWEHEAGDIGGRKVSGRRRIVADERGRTYVVPGSSRMRFDPARGLVG